MNKKVLSPVLNGGEYIRLIEQRAGDMFEIRGAAHVENRLAAKLMLSGGTAC